MKPDIFNCYEFCRNAKEYEVPTHRCFEGKMTFKLEYNKGQWNLTYYEGSEGIALGPLRSPADVYAAITLIKQDVEAGTKNPTKWSRG